MQSIEVLHPLADNYFRSETRCVDLLTTNFDSAVREPGKQSRNSAAHAICHASLIIDEGNAAFSPRKVFFPVPLFTVSLHRGSLCMPPVPASRRHNPLWGQPKSRCRREWENLSNSVCQYFHVKPTPNKDRSKSSLQFRTPTPADLVTGAGRCLRQSHVHFSPPRLSGKKEEKDYSPARNLH